MYGVQICTTNLMLHFIFECLLYIIIPVMTAQVLTLPSKGELYDRTEKTL